jgi:hypothetical protein
MKKNYLSLYEAPALEIIEVKIEQGFAASPLGGAWTEDIVDGGEDTGW